MMIMQIEMCNRRKNFFAVLWKLDQFAIQKSTVLNYCSVVELRSATANRSLTIDQSNTMFFNFISGAPQQEERFSGKRRSMRKKPIHTGTTARGVSGGEFLGGGNFNCRLCFVLEVGS